MLAGGCAPARSRVACRGQGRRLHPFARGCPRWLLHGARDPEHGVGQALPWVVVRGRPSGDLLTHTREPGGDRPIEVIEVEGLRDVVEGAELERLLGEADVLVRGHHDDGNVLVELTDPPKHLNAIEPGHAHVEENEIRPAAADRGERLDAARRLLDGVPLGDEVLGQDLAHRSLIIDDQNPSESHQSVFYPSLGPRPSPPGARHVRVDQL